MQSFFCIFAPLLLSPATSLTLTRFVASENLHFQFINFSISSHATFHLATPLPIFTYSALTALATPLVSMGLPHGRYLLMANFILSPPPRKTSP
jgi:hypothetical protein